MAFKEFQDVDGNGLSDVSQPQEENQFDKLDSNEIEESLAREEPDGDELDSESVTEEAGVFWNYENIRDSLNSDDDWGEDISEIGVEEAPTLEEPEENELDSEPAPGEAGDFWSYENIRDSLNSDDDWDEEEVVEPDADDSKSGEFEYDAGLDDTGIPLDTEQVDAPEADTLDDEDFVDKNEPDSTSRIDTALDDESNPEAEQSERDASSVVGASDQTRLHEAGAHADGHEKASDTQEVRQSADKSLDEISAPKLHNTERTLSGRELTEEETEINNRFRGDQFKPENSFHESVDPEKRSKLVEANAACTCGFNENLDGHIATNDAYLDSMSDEQKEYLDELKELRDTVPEVTEDTVMQKVVTEDVYKHYIGDKEPQYTDVQGCAAKAEDASPFTNNMQQAYETERLDFDGSTFESPAKNGGDMYVVRFTSDHCPSNSDIPTIDAKTKPPCTETGFTGSEAYLTLEYKYPRETKITDGAIYEVDHEGNEVLVATWNDRTKRFDKIE